MTVQELYERIDGSYEYAKKVLMMDPLIAKFALKFLDDGSCDTLLTALAAGDEAGIFAGAHALKGVCANLGFNSLSQAASVLAEEFRPGSPRTMDQAQVDSQAAQVKALYDRTVEAIRQFQAEQ